MKFIIILIFVVVGIPILKAFFEAVGKTREQAALEKVVLSKFIKSVHEHSDEMTIEFNEEVAKILGLDSRKTFKLIGKVINGDDFTGYYRSRYEKYAVKYYIDDIVELLKGTGYFKEIEKDEHLDRLKAIEKGEYQNYKYEYNINKWTIKTNSSFYITLATFSKNNGTCFVFGMTEY